MGKIKKIQKLTNQLEEISVPSAIRIVIILFALLAIACRCIFKSPTVNTDEIVSVLYSNRKEIAKKVLARVQNLEKFEYCTKKKHGVCFSEPFKLKGSEKLTLLNAQLAVVDDESKFRLLPNPYEVYVVKVVDPLLKRGVRYKWECSIFQITDCKDVTLQEGEILFKKNKKDGYWRLFLPAGSIKISNQKATLIRYVPQIYESFKGFEIWVFKKHSTEIEELKKEVRKICSTQKVKKCSFDEKENPIAQILTEKVIDYAVENLPDAFLYPYKKVFFKLEGTEEYVAKDELVDVEERKQTAQLKISQFSNKEIP